MNLRFTNLFIALILSVGFVTAQVINDGIYAIQNAPQVEGSIYDKFMTNPGSLGAIMTMSAKPDSIALESDSTRLWVVRSNGINFNITSLDEQFLASSDGAKGVLIENTEENRNSTDAGALINITDQGTGLRFETNTASNGIRAWNGRRTGGQFVGMGGSAADGYFWSLVRISGLDGAPYDLDLSSRFIADSTESGAVVGTLSAKDSTENETLTYAFETDSILGADNDAFTLVGDTLKINDGTNLEIKSEYRIRLKVTDAGGQVFGRAFTIVVYSGQYTNDGIYLIQNAPQAEGSTYNKFMTQPDSVGDIMTMTDGAATNNIKWIVKKNGDNFNIMSKDEQFLASSDGAKGVLIANTEENRNSTDAGALINITDQGTGLRFETNTASNGLRAWNGRRTGGSQVGMGGSAADGYFWTLIRLGDIFGAPSDLALSTTYIEENNVAGAAVGVLSAMDPTVGDTLIYAFEADTVDGVDNNAFTLDGDTLRINANADFETQSEYKIKLSVTDSSGLVFRQAFTITVIDVNENQAPTAIALSSESIAENEAVGTVVGTLSATDPDDNTTFTYTLSGADAASFSVDDADLKSTEMFDFETKASYSITVTVSDGELTFSQDFTIAIEDVDEAVPLGAIEFSEVAIYPNPAVSWITVEVNGLQRLQLLDLGGRILLETNNNNLNVETIKNGIYLLKVQAISGTDVRRVIINH